jgi:putative ABC transport system permease protein
MVPRWGTTPPTVLGIAYSTLSTVRRSQYILRSLLHYRFAYLGVLAGAVLGATVLLGALFAGDSVAASLKQIGAYRIGQTTHLLAAGDRFFRQALADDFSAAAKIPAAPLIYARGTASIPTGRATANQIQLVGVTDAFWSFAPQPPAISVDAARSSVAINDTLARRLQLKAGDTLIIRLQKPGIIVGNAPVAGAESTLQSLRCTVAHVVDDTAFGRFSLDATQVPQPSVFLPIELLQQAIERPGRANVLLLNATGVTQPPTVADLEGTLRATATLADYGLTLKWIEAARMFEIASDRIFIDPEIAEALMSALPTARTVVSYLVNELRLQDRATPYSIVTATSSEAAPFLPPDLGPKEVVLNDWLADDLQAKAGDEIRLTYYQAGSGDALIEADTTFKVRAVIPLQGLAADKSWMPAFPGISDVANTSDWDPGLPLDLNRIRPKDEKYWDDHRGAPKAFLSPDAGRSLWSTRWGNYTALRIPFDQSREAELNTTILRALRPELNQLSLRNLRASANESAQSAVDFGGLFVGMSFFLILAALGLVAMLFQLSLLQRNREDALLGAVGISNRKLLRWRLSEGVIILILAAVAGLGLATLYTRGILRFLESIWAGQGGGSTFVFSAHPTSIGIGAGTFLLLSLFVLWLAIRRLRRRALSIRLAAQVEDTAPLHRVRRRSRALALIAVVIGVAAIAISGRSIPPQGAFYLAGFAFLVAGIAFCRSWMALPGSSDAADFNANHLGAVNLKSRRARSLTVVGLIATAVFMVLSVASFRKHVGSDWLNRSSGTGGFAFWVETTAPQNLPRENRAKGFEIFQRHTAELGEIIPLRAGVGDNVNCFNLNTSSQPKLLAVDAAALARRNAFAPKVPAGGSESTGWNVLRVNHTTDAIPAFVDETTLMWALKRKVGDVLTYADENGRTFDVRIAGVLPDSIFQGYLIVDESPFLARFPSSAGYSVFLLDAREPAALEPLRGRLETTLRDAGGRVDITRDVLAAFHEIENTYIAIFNVLGSLGVILGSLGLAIVVARNLRERRGEFAVMSAIGIPRSVMARMVFSEFGRLVGWGIAIGTLASVVAVWPSITALPAAPTLLLVCGMIVGIIALNLACGWLIFRWSMRDLRPSVALAAG